MFRLRLYGLAAVAAAALIGIQAATFFRGGAEAADAQLATAAGPENSEAAGQPIRVSPDDAGEHGGTLVPSLLNEGDQPHPSPETSELFGGEVSASLDGSIPQDLTVTDEGNPLDLESAREPLADVGRWLAGSDAERHVAPAWVSALADSLEAAPAASSSGSPAKSAPRLDVPKATAAEAVSIEIANPAANQGAVRFLLGGEIVSLPPGESKSLHAAPDAFIRFDRGAKFGAASYPARQGRYEFFVGKRGWDLKPAE